MIPISISSFAKGMMGIIIFLQLLPFNLLTLACIRFGMISKWLRIRSTITKESSLSILCIFEQFRDVYCITQTTANRTY